MPHATCNLAPSYNRSNQIEPTDQSGSGLVCSTRLGSMRLDALQMLGCSLGSVTALTLPRGMSFTVCRDDDALKWILNQADSAGEFVRCRLRVFKFEFDVVHRGRLITKLRTRYHDLKQPSRTTHLSTMTCPYSASPLQSTSRKKRQGLKMFKKTT